MRLLGLLLLFAATDCLAQDGWERYRLADPDSVIAAHEENCAEVLDGSSPVGVCAIMKDFPLTFEGAYGGQVRPISAGPRQLIEWWGQAQQFPADYIDLYTREVLVGRGGVEGWVPIQEELAELFDSLAIPKGAPLLLYVQFVGGRAENDETEWVFVTTRFDEL